MKRKPHYNTAGGDHALFSDIIGGSTPYAEFTKAVRYEALSTGLIETMTYASADVQHHNNPMFGRFLDRCQIKFDAAYKAWAMFVAPSQGQFIN